jgi:UDP-N-acetylglucosamine 1-carboxyvinyltransferase
MDKLRIKGGLRLAGQVAVSGSKNASLPIMAASLLAAGRCRLKGVPALRDVKTFARLLEHMGVKTALGIGTGAKAPLGGAFEADPSGLDNPEAPYELVKTMRASVLVLGPLAARYGRARVSLPGGCAIGARPINLHLMGLEKMGAEIKLEEGYVIAKAKRLKGASIYFDIPTVTGTENLMMAAALARGTTLLENAAREPEVTDLANLLISMGAKIEGAGQSVIKIEGVRELKPFDYRVIPDRIEAATFATAAAITGGDILIKNTVPEHMEAILIKLRESGAEITAMPEGLRVKGPSRPGPVSITTMPFPGFPTDMQAQFMSLVSIADGTSVISETIFENRFMHVPELRRMGADITLQGGIATIKGVPRLKAAEVMATDLRASASLVLAALAGRGTTTIHRLYHLDRGYERMEVKLRALGANAKRIKS